MENPDGTPIWFELNTPHEARAGRFYAATLGWQIARSDMAEHGGYLIATSTDDVAVAGMMTPAPEAPAFPGWTVYFAAGDVDEMVERARTLGGEVAFGPIDIPGVGRFATLRDPQDVTFSVIKGNGPEPSTAFRTGAHPGHGVWIELATPHPDGALAFYSALFGWAKEGAMSMGDMGDYAFIGVGDARPGAIMPSTTTGVPARWNWYVYVPDIDAAVATVRAEGGTVSQDPDQIPGGDYATRITDPDGSQIGLIGPRQ